jgi:hypothetical protein
MANSRNSRPTTSPMNSSGISTAISETVSEMMVKPICSAPLSAASSGFSPFLDVAGDVLDHDDGVVDDEAGGDRQRHQREVVEAEAEQVHHAERADQRERHGDARDDRGGTLRRNRKITITTSATASISSNCTSSTEARMVWCGRSAADDVDAAGSVACSCGSSALTRSTTSMTLAPGWRWMLRMTAGRAVGPGRERLDVLGVVDHFGDVGQRTGAPFL